jgi:hypothetical protein
VADGVIAQEQADFMLKRMNTMMGDNFDGGPGFGTNGCPRGGQWDNQPTPTP